MKVARIIYLVSCAVSVIYLVSCAVSGFITGYAIYSL